MKTVDLDRRQYLSNQFLFTSIKYCDYKILIFYTEFFITCLFSMVLNFPHNIYIYISSSTYLTVAIIYNHTRFIRILTNSQKIHFLSSVWSVLEAKILPQAKSVVSYIRKIMRISFLLSYESSILYRIKSFQVPLHTYSRFLSIHILQVVLFCA